jgi:hypothetical protein
VTVARARQFLSFRPCPRCLLRRLLTARAISPSGVRPESRRSH